MSQNKVKVNFKPCTCPLGFQQIHKATNFSCDCECHQAIQPFTTVCNQTTESFFREGTDFWIQYVNYSDHPGYITYPNCPFDYCHPSQPGVWINLNLPNGTDGQCAPHRTGLLCGMCMPDYSISAGSSHCMACSKWYLLYSVFLTIGIAAFGIALVVVILVFNITVAVGAINGITLYANVVAANSSIFLPFSKPHPFTLFIAWLNLSIGFDMCFYRNMDSYIKTWLLLAFPAYVIVLVITIILFGKFSSRFANLIGKRNPVATLATLLLLSYTKLLQTSIRILSFAVLTYPDGSWELVWLPDASVKYFWGKHFPFL